MSTDGVGFLVDIGSKDGWTAAIKPEKRKIYIEKEKRKDIKLPGNEQNQGTIIRKCYCQKLQILKKKHHAENCIHCQNLQRSERKGN